jgi:hypothetical protein
MPDVQDPPEGHHPGSPDGGAGDGPAAGQVSGESGTGKSPPAKPTAPSGLTAVQLALEAGWTMAVLYGKIESIPPGKLLGLPTANELQLADRRKLELERLRHLLKRLAQMPEFSETGLPTQVPTPDEVEADLKPALSKLNLEILCGLAEAQSQAQLAYELGRSLRDTANPPDELPAGGQPTAPAPSRQFARGRIATLQGWLAALSGELPQQSAAVVAASLGRWSEFVAVTTGTPKAQLKNNEDAKIAAATAQAKNAGDAEKVAAATAKYLLRQGDLWLMLLTGTRTTSGLLSPEGYVAAGELALRRSVAIIRRVLQHYWVALLTVAIALGVILYLSAIYLHGAAQVWTNIAAIAGSLGISARAIASTTARLAAEAERPVFAMAEEDVMAWAITTMPPLRLTPRRARKLRKAGIAPTSSLGRV